jgi:hypothetical protein
MSLENFVRVWSNSAHRSTTLLVHLAIADTLGPTRIGEVHFDYLSRRARASLAEIDECLSKLMNSGDISSFGGIGKATTGGSFLCRLHFDQMNQPQSLSRQQSTRPDLSYLDRIEGYVYLLQCGPYRKIGHSGTLTKRMLQLGIQLPHKPQLIHVIATDTHQALETEIKTYFAKFRLNGEWFDLTEEHVSQFKHYGCSHGSVIDERRRSHVYLDGEGFHVPDEFFPEDFLNN